VFDYVSRRARARIRMQQEGMDAMLLFLSSNLLYLVGWTDNPGERFLGALITSEREAMVVPRLYADEVATQANLTDLRIWEEQTSPFELVVTLAREFGVARGRWAVDDAIPFSMIKRLQAAIPGCTLVPASRVMAPLRAQKETGEIERMRQAARITQEAVAETLAEARPGLPARDVAAAIEDRLRRKGASALAGSIVAVGPTAALPHARAREEPLQAGQVLLIDVGCRFQGYRSDITRTYTLGEPPSKVQRAYGAVRDAYEAARRLIRPGIPLGEVDRTAREAIAAAGFESNFIHRLGHGIGLDPKEEPYAVAGNPDPCLTGHTFSVEPGVYFPGEFGLRLEDIIVVTETGNDALTDLPRDLVVLPV
jgi:Xaa-Pro aminopeptidase